MKGAVDVIDVYYFIILFILLFTALTFYKYWQKEINECNNYYQNYMSYNCKCGLSQMINNYNNSLSRPFNIFISKGLNIP